MNSIMSTRLSVAAVATVALSVAVPLVALSPSASGSPSPVVKQQQDPATGEPGQAGLPDQDGRYGKAGAPSVLNVADHGALTKASNDAPDAIARAYLKAQQGEFGLAPQEVDALRLTMSDTSAGATFLRYQQVSAGRDVFGGTGLVTIDGEGRVLLASGSFVSGAGGADAARLTAGEAVALVADAVAPYDAAESARRLGAKDGTVTFENTLAVADYDGAPVAAELVTVGTAEGPRPAWQVQADRASNASYVVLVDAVTGEVLVRQNQLSEDNQGTVFQGEDPEAGGRSQITFPAGWATAGDTTSGNNVNAYQDAAGDNSAQAADQPHDADRHWNYTWNDPWGASVAGAEADLPLTGADRDAVVTQLFYYTNWYHDYAYDLGFTETARNFQNDNFGLGGSGGDAVEAESDANFTGQQCDSGGNPVKCLNNANFNANGADGTKPRMQMYVGDTNPGGMARRTQRANNRDTIIHEYTHGISGRIVSDGNLAGGIQSSSLGEGWSDAFATSINDDPVYGEYNNGDYTNGIRGVAYDDDSLEYGDFAGTSEHDNGRIWAMNMWEVRAALIAKYGAATGKDKHERLMMLGLKNTADTPSFHDARTGYLVADSIQNPTATAGVGANWCRLWFVFADNELGVTAASDPDTANAGSITVSTDTPDECDPGAAIAPVGDRPEGSDIIFDGTGSTAGGDAGDALSYAWDLDDDGAYDDSTSATPTWAFGDNGAHTVGLQVSNASGYTDTTSVSFNTTNVAPTVTVDLADLAGMEENDTRTVAATFSDPGWQDTYSGNVDLGTSYRPDVNPAARGHHAGRQGPR